MKKIKIEYIIAIVCAVIIGSSIVISQYMKQGSIERQLRVKTANEEETKREKDSAYRICVNIADIEYWDYVELNGTKNASGSITAPTRVWETAKKDKQTAIDNCYRRVYKTN